MSNASPTIIPENDDRSKAAAQPELTAENYLAAAFAQCISFGRWAGEQSTRRDRAWLMWNDEIVSDDEWAENAAKQFLEKSAARSAIQRAGSEQ